MKKWQELSKKAKVGLIGGAAVVLIGGTAGAVKVNADNQYRNQKSEITKKLATASEKGELTQKVSQLVDKEGFLKKELTSEEVSKLQVELSTLNDEVKQFVSIRNETVNLSDIDTLKQDLSVAEKKLGIEDQLKIELTAYDGWLKADSDVKKFDISNSASVESLEGVKKALGAANLTEDSWTKKTEDVLQTVEKQLSAVATAEKLVNNLYKDKKVNPAVKRADYEKAVKAVKALTRKTDKESLNKKLDAVKKVIEEREKAEKAKKEAEAKKKAEAEAAEKAKADAAAKAEENKEVASENDTETANQPASDQKTDSDWSDSNAGSDWSGSSNTGNNSNWGSGSSSNQGATTGGNQSSGNSGGGSTNTGGNNNQSSGGSSNNGSGSNGGNSSSTGGNNSGGSTGGGNSGGSTGGNSGSDGGTTDADMEADGWIKPPYKIGSIEFWDWLDSLGYDNYFVSGEWIQPY